LSQQKRFSLDGKLRLKKYNLPFLFNDRRYHEHSSFISSLDSLLEKEFAIYCLNNYHIYNYPPTDKAIVVFYEHLLFDAENELDRIFKEWRVSVNLDTNMLYRPSSEADYEGIKQNKLQQVSKWKNQLSENQLKSFQLILDHFGIKLYTMDDPLPKLQKRNQELN
jgi:hypothetical protein